MLLTENEIDGAFNRLFGSISAYMAALHEEQQARFPGSLAAEQAFKNFNAIVERFTQELRSMRGEINEVEVGVRGKRAELAVACSDLKRKQDELEALVKKAKVSA